MTVIAMARQFAQAGCPFAAALAEALLRSNPAPLNVRLLRAAGKPAPTYAPSDRVTEMCIARSEPDNVAALLGSPIASAAETASAGALAVAKARCSPPGVAIDAGAYALRSILATASYRLLAANTPPERGMKFFLLIAIVAIIAIVVISMQRSGTWITRIDRRRDEEEDDGER